MKLPSISIIVPVHNEESTVGRTIMEIIEGMKDYDYEIIVVDDNSDDSTSDVLDGVSKESSKVRFFRKLRPRPGPSGLGSALKYGFSRARGSILIPFMGDLSDDPKDLPKLVEKVEEGYDIVVGSRFISGSKLLGYPLVKLFFNRLYNRLFGFLFLLRVRDISNAFKAYRKEAIERIKPRANGFEITSEILLKAHMLGLKIAEVPVSWRGRKHGRSKFGSFPSYLKVGVMYGRLSLVLWFVFLSTVLRRKITNLLGWKPCTS